MYDDEDTPGWLSFFIIAIPVAIVVLGLMVVFNIASDNTPDESLQSVKASVDILNK